MKRHIFWMVVVCGFGIATASGNAPVEPQKKETKKTDPQLKIAVLEVRLAAVKKLAKENSSAKIELEFAKSEIKSHKKSNSTLLQAFRECKKENKELKDKLKKIKEIVSSTPKEPMEKETKPSGKKPL